MLDCDLLDKEAVAWSWRSSRWETRARAWCRKPGWTNLCAAVRCFMHMGLAQLAIK